MNEQKPPSASDLYRDKYQGKLKSTESPCCPMCGAPELEELELEGIYGEPLIIAGCRKCNYRSDEKPTTSKIERLSNLYQRTIVERDQFAKLMGTMKGERDALEKENKELRKALRSEGTECDDMTFKYETLLEKIACAVGVHTWKKFKDYDGVGTVCRRCGKTERHWVNS